MRNYALKSTCLTLAILAATVLMRGAAEAEVEDWRPFPNSYDGVSVAFRVHYFPYDCNVNWRFKNNNPYPVKIEVSDKVYITNYGEKLVVDSYQTYAELKPGETQSMSGLGDQLGYDWKEFGGTLNSRGIDKNGKKVAFFVVEGIKGCKYKVTKLSDETGAAGDEGKTQSGASVSAGGAAAKKQQGTGGGVWVCKYCGEEKQSEKKPSAEGCPVGYGDLPEISFMLYDGPEPNISGGGGNWVYRHGWTRRNAPGKAQAAPKRSAVEKGSWFAFPSSYGGVKIAIKFDYDEKACKIQWRFSNGNNYPVQMDIIEHSYASNYGGFSLPQFRVGMKAGETKTMTQVMPYKHEAFGNVLRDRLTDRSGNNVDAFKVNSLSNWKYKVTKQTAPGQNKTKGGLKAPAGKTTR
jgi:hypothetical protein